MPWLPANLFVPETAQAGLRLNRPFGQGDVFENVAVASKTQIRGGEQPQPQAAARIATVILVASSCGMRKEGGELNPTVHVAPIKRLASIAPGWPEPWEQDRFLHALPLPGLAVQEIMGANLGQIGLTSSDLLTTENRVGCVSLDGMQALKGRLSDYFVRSPVQGEALETGAFEEWHELDLWEQWTERTGSPDGFQAWLDEENPNYRGSTRRRTIYQDLAGIEEQLPEGPG